MPAADCRGLGRGGSSFARSLVCAGGRSEVALEGTPPFLGMPTSGDRQKYSSSCHAHPLGQQGVVSRGGRWDIRPCSLLHRSLGYLSCPTPLASTICNRLSVMVSTCSREKCRIGVSARGKPAAWPCGMRRADGEAWVMPLPLSLLLR